MDNYDKIIGLENRTEQIEQKIDKIVELENRTERIEQKIDKILELLEKDCKKMSDHIDFVENVYDNVKMPFYYVMDKVNNLVYSQNKNILDCENNK
jgi:hypothetical protein